MDFGLVTATRRYYGGWPKAFKELGIQMNYAPRVKWTKELVQREIIALMEKGESLKAIDVKKDHPNLYRAACNLFDGYNKAVESIGFKYSDYGKKVGWTKKEIQNEIKKLAKDKKPLNASWMAKNRSALYQAAKNKFGNWGNAVDSIGIDYKKVRKLQKWDSDMLVNTIRKMYKDGEPLDAVYMRKHHQKLLSAGEGIFGNWKTTIMVCGIDYDKVRRKREKWNKKNVLEAILERKQRNLSLSYKRTYHENSGLVNAAMKNFGSWRAAVEAAGLNYEDYYKK